MASLCRLSRGISRPISSFPLRPRLASPIAIEPVTVNQCQRRTFLSRRQTSFWAPSYPGDRTVDVEKDSGPPPLQVPYTPPPPLRDETSSGPRDDAASPGPREKKQKYLRSLMYKAGELSLPCSIMDSEGNWGTEEQKYSKLELCREHELDPRDLRKLDSLTPNLVPVILTRKTCILISMLHLRALIKPDKVIVFDSAGAQASGVQKRFKEHLQRNIKLGLEMKESGEEEVILSYEHRALESFFIATASALEEEMAFTRHIVKHLLNDLENHIDRENLKKLLHYSKKISAFQSRARYVKSSVDELLDSDEDLSAMYLTSRAQGRPRALHDHEQLELLLESFVKQVEEIVSEVDTTVANMVSTQEIAELMLDSGRNALLALDIKISIATLGIGTGALFAGLFGMNLTTHLEDHPYAFLTASGLAFALSILIIAYGLRILRRVRRVALSGRNPTVLSSVLGSASWDSSIAQFSRGFDPSLVDMRTELAKRAIWDRIWWRRGNEPKDKYTQIYRSRAGPRQQGSAKWAESLTMDQAKQKQEHKWANWRKASRTEWS